MTSQSRIRDEAVITQCLAHRSAVAAYSGRRRRQRGQGRWGMQRDIRVRGRLAPPPSWLAVVG